MTQKKYHSVVVVIDELVAAPPNKYTCPCGVKNMPAPARPLFIDGPAEKVFVAVSKICVSDNGVGDRMLPDPPPAIIN